MLRRFVGCLSVAAVGMLGCSSHSLAAANHPFLGASGSYEDACGVALHGGVYVSDFYHDTILTPGGPLSEESVNGGPCKLAFDAAGDLYVNNWHENVVKYRAGELVTGAGTIVDGAEPTGVAVDQGTGLVYVAHRTYISQYEPDGTLLAKLGEGSLHDAYGVAVSEYPTTNGYVYVPDAAEHTVKVFNPAVNPDTPVQEIDGGATPQGAFKYLFDSEIAVDNSPTSPSYGHIFVLDNIGHGLATQPEGAIDEFNAAGAFRSQITGFDDAEPSGIALDPEAGPSNGNVFVTSGNTENSSLFVYGPTAPSRPLELSKAGAGDGSVSSSPSGINCGEHCAAEFDEGQIVTLFETPDAHSGFTGWNVTGAEPCPGLGSCTVSMRNNVEVVATFDEPTQQNLTVSTVGGGSVTSSPGEIDCPRSCTEHFAEGRIVTLTAAPEPHERIVNWTGCTVQPNPAECKVTMTAAHSVTATFEAIPQLPLSVTPVGSGQGTVTSYPGGIVCPGSACSASFDQGATVYLLAAPSPGTDFAGFTGGGCTGNATLCAVSMSGAQSITAAFGGAAAGPSAGSAAAGSAAATQATAASSTSFAVTSIRTAGNAALLTVKTDEAGTLVTAGAGTIAQKRHLDAGTARVRVRLGLRARHRLRRRGRPALHVAVGFVPDQGSASSRTVTIGFRAPVKRARASHRQ